MSRFGHVLTVAGAALLFAVDWRIGVGVGLIVLGVMFRRDA